MATDDCGEIGKGPCRCGIGVILWSVARQTTGWRQIGSPVTSIEAGECENDFVNAGYASIKVEPL